VNENQVLEIILTRFSVVQDNDESIGNKEYVRINEEDEEEDVRIQEENEKNFIIQEENENENDESTDEEEDYSTSKTIFF